MYVKMIRNGVVLMLTSAILFHSSCFNLLQSGSCHHLADLVDIPITQAEACQTAHLDSFAMQTADNANTGKSTNIPLGKLVI